MATSNTVKDTGAQARPVPDTGGPASDLLGAPVLAIESVGDVTQLPALLTPAVQAW